MPLVHHLRRSYQDQSTKESKHAKIGFIPVICWNIHLQESIKAMVETTMTGKCWVVIKKV